MTREELVLALESIALLASMNLPGIDEADDVIAAIENLRQRVVLSSPLEPPPGSCGLRAGPVQKPPCACGGREVLEQRDCIAWLKDGKLAYATDIGAEEIFVRIVTYRSNIGVGQDKPALPAEEVSE